MITGMKSEGFYCLCYIGEGAEMVLAREYGPYTSLRVASGRAKRERARKKEMVARRTGGKGYNDR
jgi:hypothetical protein